jgi:heme o synthase
MIKLYYMLTKPGIIMGNLLTTAAGFLLASKGNFNLPLFIATFSSITCVIGSACVFNNYIDRKCDKKMERTKGRALATGSVSPVKAITFASVLLVLGTVISGVYINALVTIISLVGVFVYVIMYSIWKYKSASGTLIGSVAGALPPLIGYCAVSNSLDLGAFTLFAIIVLWQMPHFYAIAIYRLKDYTAAAIPVLPVKKGIHTTKIHMLLYIVFFMGAAFMLTVLGYTGYAYLAVASVASVIWLVMGIRGFKADDDTKWARKMFRFSLVVVTSLSIMIAVDGRAISSLPY